MTRADRTVVFCSGRARQPNPTSTYTVEVGVRESLTNDPGLNNGSSATLVVP